MINPESRKFINGKEKGNLLYTNIKEKYLKNREILPSKIRQMASALTEE